MSKLRKTNADHNPPQIEDLGDGTFYYNFNVEKKEERDENRKLVYSWDYDQVRLPFPVDISEIQTAVEEKGFTNHNVKIKEE